MRLPTLVVAVGLAAASLLTARSGRCGEPLDCAIFGAVRSLTLESATLGQTREVWVGLPDDYETSGGRYPVLYVLDAKWHFLPALAAVRALAETSYIGSHRIPRLIVVGVVSRDRNEEDTPTRCPSQHGMTFPTSGGADRFLEFLGDELIPLVDARFRTEPHRMLAGWSLGGLLTMHALFERPELFGGHLAISPSLWWDHRLLVERGTELATGEGARERDLVLTIGTGEEGGLCYEAVHELVRRWDQEPVAGLEFSFVEIPGEDHNHAPFKAYIDGLRALFADWFLPEEAFGAGLGGLQAHYAALSARWGYRIDVPDHIYTALARSLLAEGRGPDAIAVVRAQCEAQPDSPIHHFQLGEVCRQAEDSAGARQAYEKALALEHARSAPDTVFINWVEGVLSELGDDG